MRIQDIIDQVAPGDRVLLAGRWGDRPPVWCTVERVQKKAGRLDPDILHFTESMNGYYFGRCAGSTGDYWDVLSIVPGGPNYWEGMLIEKCS